MVLAAPTVLPHVPRSYRGVASGAIFMGIGLGIAASGTLVPLLLHQGLTSTWIGLGALALIVTLVAWTGWPRQNAIDVRSTYRVTLHLHRTSRLRALYAQYALYAFGLVPHMIFLVDFVARGLGQGLHTGAEYWVLFGLGAIVDPVLSGLAFGPALPLAYLIQATAVDCRSSVPARLGSSFPAFASAHSPPVLSLLSWAASTSWWRITLTRKKELGARRVSAMRSFSHSPPTVCQWCSFVRAETTCSCSA
jgi:hypothetical protein